MKEAFAGKSQAYQRYLAFVERAADEYKEGIYKLFQAVAEKEPRDNCPVCGAVRKAFHQVGKVTSRECINKRQLYGSGREADEALIHARC